MEIKRGYVKWTDEDGVFHKELLVDHPELLEDALPREQIAAEEARRLHEHAESLNSSVEEEAEQDQWDTLFALQGAPEDVLTTGDLVAVDDGSGEEIIVPASEVFEPVTSETLNAGKLEEEPRKDLWSEDHHEALQQLREETT